MGTKNNVDMWLAYLSNLGFAVSRPKSPGWIVEAQANLCGAYDALKTCTEKFGVNMFSEPVKFEKLQKFEHAYVGVVIGHFCIGKSVFAIWAVSSNKRYACAKVESGEYARNW